MQAKKTWMLLLCLITFGNAGCAGEVPADIGLTNGKLAPCPSSPNCVSSQADPSDETHYMPPIPFEGSGEEAQQRITSVVNSMERTEILMTEPGYIHSTFRSRIMGFVDDVEFVVDEEAGVIHFRSASRLGYGDGGVNRNRMEAITQAF